MPRLKTLAPRVKVANLSVVRQGQVGPREPEGQWHKPNDRRVLTGRPWRRLRDQIMLRDKFMCQCEECNGQRYLAHEVDHILALAEGGTDEPSNLRAINRDCHKAKSRAEAARGAGGRV